MKNLRLLILALIAFTFSFASQAQTRNVIIESYATGDTIKTGGVLDFYNPYTSSWTNGVLPDANGVYVITDSATVLRMVYNSSKQATLIPPGDYTFYAYQIVCDIKNVNTIVSGTNNSNYYRMKGFNYPGWSSTFFPHGTVNEVLPGILTVRSVVNNRGLNKTLLITQSDYSSPTDTVHVSFCVTKLEVNVLDNNSNPLPALFRVQTINWSPFLLANSSTPSMGEPFYLHPGNYKIRVFANGTSYDINNYTVPDNSNAGECTDEDTQVTLIIDPCDDEEKSADIDLGPEIEPNRLSVYPNPADEEVNIEAPGEITIINMLGQEMYTGEPGKIDTRAWAKGQYIIKYEEQTRSFLLR